MSTSFDELFNRVHGKSSESAQSPSSSSFDELYEKAQSQSPSRAKSLASAPTKGLLRGAQNFSPIPSFGPIPSKMKENLLQQFLPTQDEPLENILEMAGENIPLVAMGEGGLLKKGTQALAGGLSKKVAQDLDAPEWAQELAGAAGMLAPGALQAAGRKTLSPSGKQAQVVEFLKSKGLSDKEITPLIQDKKKLDWLSKGASKVDEKAPLVSGIKEKLGNVFQDIRMKGKEMGHIQGSALRDFENDFFKQLDNIPEHYKSLIKRPIEHLMENPIDYTALHDFNQAINAIVKDVQGGKAAVGIMKGPIEKAQARLSPSLYKETKQVNDAYIRLHKFTDKMTQKNWDSLINLGEAGSGLIGVLTLNPDLLTGTALVAGGRKGLQQILTNPRLQNIHRKMWESVLKNKIPQAMKLMQVMEKEMSKSQDHT